MDAAALRAEISLALAANLGTYTLLNGEVTPAISVRQEGVRLAAGTTAAGLEVVILAEPRLNPVSAYLQQEAIREYYVFLVGWDETADITAAAERLVYVFPGTVWQEIPIAKRVGPTNQARVIIRSDATLGLIQPPGPAEGASAVTLVITGSATGTSGGSVTGLSAMTLGVSGIATGAVLVSGTSVGSLLITGAAAGSVQSQGSGASSVTLVITGSAAGSIAVVGASSLALPIAGVASGAVPVVGTSSSTLAITGAATGAIGAVATGASSATFAIAGTAAGSVAVAGASSQTLAITGSAVAGVRVLGASSFTMAIVGTTTATALVTGASSATFGITGSAAATNRVSGTSSIALTISGTAAGTSGSSSYPAPTLWLPLQDDLLDDSANGFTVINSVGTLPTIVSITSPVGTAAALWDGDYRLEYASTTLLNPGTGDFTITAFVRPASGPTFPHWVAKGDYQSSTGSFLSNRWGGDGDVYMAFGNPATQFSAGSLPINTWRRLTIVRSGNTITFYNGTTVGGTADATGIDLTSTHPFTVGSRQFGDSWRGHITDFIYIKGTALTFAQIEALQTIRYPAS